MKTNILLTIGAVTLAAFTFSATATDVLLSPRAAGNQTRVVPAAPAVSVNYLAPASALLAPRAAANQAKIVAGTTLPIAKCMMASGFVSARNVWQAEMLSGGKRWRSQPETCQPRCAAAVATLGASVPLRPVISNRMS